MARNFMSKADYGDFGGAFLEGRKQRDDELFRKAVQDLEAEKWAFDKYKKPKKNEYGLFGGFESNLEDRERDLPSIKKRVPWAFSEDPSKPVAPFQGIAAKQMEEPGPSLDEQTDLINRLQKLSGKQIKLEDAAQPAQRAPQSQPMQEQPLLANPQQKKTLDQSGNPVTLQGPAAVADKVVYDESKAQKITTPTGETKNVIPAEETGQYFKKDTVVAPEPRVPQPALQPPSVEALPSSRAPADFNPSDYYLSRLAEYTTTAQAKDTQKDVAIGNLPEEWQRIILKKEPNDPISPQEQAITIPADMVKAVIEQSYKPQAATKAGITFDAALSDAIGEIEAGQPLNVVQRKLTVARGGKLPKTDLDELQRAKSRYDANKRADTLAGMRKEEKETARTEKAVEKQDRAVERYKKSIDDTGVMAALPFLQQIERETGVVTGTNASKEKLPGVGTNLARAVPFFGNELSMAIAKSYKGGATSQALQGLLNAQIRTQSGQAVTKYEEGRNLVQQGMAAGGSEEDVARGIQLMVEGFREALGSVNTAYPPEVVELYQSRGGFKGVDQALAGQRKEKKESKPQEKRKESANSAYDQELNKAQSLMQIYRAQVQQEMEKGGLGAAWASRKVNERKAMVDKFLKDKYGKGYVDGQNP